jgi:hypothetical protein
MKEELQQLRDLMFCYGYAEVPADNGKPDEEEFDKIWDRALDRGWSITRQLFPNVEVFDEGIAILGTKPNGQNDLMMILSEYWFDRIDAALADL